MSTDFSNQLSSLFDDVAATIQPRADFEAARAGAAQVPLTVTTTSPGGRRPGGRHLVAAAAAAATLFAGGVAAFQLAGDDDSVATSPEERGADETVPAENDIAPAVPDAPSDEPGTAGPVSERPAAAAVIETGGSTADAVERTAAIASVDWERTPPVVVIEGTAPSGEAIEVFSLAGAADTVARDGAWRAELRLTTLDAAPDQLLVIVEFADDDSVHLFVERPATEGPKADDTEPDPTTEPSKAEEPKAVEPKAAEPSPAPPKQEQPATIGFAAALSKFVPTNEPPKALLHGTAAPGTKVVASSPYGEQHVVAGDGGGWELWLLLPGMPLETTAPIRVSHPASGGVAEFSVTTPAKPEPPKDVAFTAKLVEGGTHEGELWRRFGGTATPGSIVHAKSEYGTSTTTADEHGGWTLKLWLEGTPAGSNIGVKIVNSATDATHSFTIETPPAPEPPTSIEFTAKVTEGGTHEGIVWRRFGGTARPGSTVQATSDHGTVSATVAEHGEWTLKLWLDGAPAGSNVGVQVSNTASPTVHNFTIETPPAPEPPAVDFTANAALVESAGSPAFNEYWGTAQPGSVIVISSPYGGAERTAGEAGGWDARVEFPEAPLGQVFTVKVKSLATGQVKEFPMKRVEPIG